MKIKAFECGVPNVQEMEEEQHFPRLFNWHNMHPFVNTISSRMEFPHYADCQQLPQPQTMSTHETGNSQSLRGQRSEGHPSSSAVPPTTTTKSATISHQSSDSISSAHSFTFPM